MTPEALLKIIAGMAALAILLAATGLVVAIWISLGFLRLQPGSISRAIGVSGDIRLGPADWGRPAISITGMRRAHAFEISSSTRSWVCGEDQVTAIEHQF